MVKITTGIYKIINKETGQIYIGQSINIERRFKEHINSTNCPYSYIDNAIQKYGKNNFDFEIIEEFNENIPFLDDVLNDSEQYYIAAYNTFKDDFHYNLTIGGDGTGSGENNPFYGKKHSEETKKKMSENCDNSGENNPFYGKKHSEESKKKMSESLSGKNNPFYGKHHSEETKKKMSEAKSGGNHPMYGKHLSAKTKKKISEANSGENNPMYGKKHTEKAKKKMSEVKKGENNPRWKNYPRIIKAGKKNNKQTYAIQYQGKVIKTSISIDKLKKWFSKNYPNKELEINF